MLIEKENATQVDDVTAFLFEDNVCNMQLDFLTLQQLITAFNESWGPGDVTGFVDLGSSAITSGAMYRGNLYEYHTLTSM